jgi:hypothetical protein
MDFNALAQLEWSRQGSGGSISGSAPLRDLVRKVLKMTSVERQRCSITVANFTYQRAEKDRRIRSNQPFSSEAGALRHTPAGR